MPIISIFGRPGGLEAIVIGNAQKLNVEAMLEPSNDLLYLMDARNEIWIVQRVMGAPLLMVAVYVHMESVEGNRPGTFAGTAIFLENNGIESLDLYRLLLDLLSQLKTICTNGERFLRDLSSNREKFRNPSWWNGGFGEAKGSSIGTIHNPPTRTIFINMASKHGGLAGDVIPFALDAAIGGALNGGMRVLISDHRNVASLATQNSAIEVLKLPEFMRMSFVEKSNVQKIQPNIEELGRKIDRINDSLKIVSTNNDLERIAKEIVMECRRNIETTESNLVTVFNIQSQSADSNKNIDRIFQYIKSYMESPKQGDADQAPSDMPSDNLIGKTALKESVEEFITLLNNSQFFWESLQSVALASKDNGKYCYAGDNNGQSAINNIGLMALSKDGIARYLVDSLISSEAFWRKLHEVLYETLVKNKGEKPRNFVNANSSSHSMQNSQTNNQGNNNNNNNNANPLFKREWVLGGIIAIFLILSMYLGKYYFSKPRQDHDAQSVGTEQVVQVDGAKTCGNENSQKHYDYKFQLNQPMEIKSIAESIMKSLPELTECESYLIGNIKILGNNGDAVLKGGSTIIVRLPDIFGTTRFKSEENKIILKMRNEKSPEVIAKEFDSLKSLADKDDPNAMYMLGLMYYRGDVLPVDRIAALNLFEKSAVLGFKPALEQIEILSANDVPYALTTKGNIYRALKQLKYAADFYERAAKLGDAQGQFRFGEALEVGAGVDTNRERAKEYYQKSAAQNYDLARKALVRMEEKQ